MADSGKPVGPELTADFFFTLLFFFIPYGAEQMNLPHLFFIGLGCWVIAIAIVIRMFWIFPLWAKHLSQFRKGLIALVFIGVFVTLFYKPVMTAYRNGDVKGQEKKPIPQAALSQSTQIQGNDNTAGNIDQNGNQNTAVIGNGNQVTNNYARGPKLSGWLVPGSGATPKTFSAGRGAQPCIIPDDHVAVFLGGSVDVEKEFPRTIIQVGSTPRLILERQKDGTLAVSMDIFDSDPDPRIIAKIVRNKFTINPNNYFTTEISKDGSRLQVTDQRDIRVLDIRYINKRALSISAILHFPGFADPLILSDNDTSWRDQHYPGNCVQDTDEPLINILPKHISGEGAIFTLR